MNMFFVFAINIVYCDTGGNLHPGGGQPLGQLCLVVMFCRMYINKIYSHPQKDRKGIPIDMVILLEDDKILCWSISVPSLGQPPAACPPWHLINLKQSINEPWCQ